MSVSWSCEKTVDFIAEVKKNPMLWDNRCKEYKNKKSNKDIVWNSIGKMFDIDGNEASKKMKNLRDEFVKAQYKISAAVRSGMGTDDFPKPDFKFFSYLDFLLPTVSHRKTVSNISEQQSSALSISEGSSTQNLPRELASTPVPSTSVAATDATTIENSGSVCLALEENCSSFQEFTVNVSENATAGIVTANDVVSSVQQKGRKKTRLGDDGSSDISNFIAWTKNEMERHRSQRDDAINVFCNSLSFKIRSFPESERDRLMFRIESFVCSEKLNSGS